MSTLRAALLAILVFIMLTLIVGVLWFLAEPEMINSNVTVGSLAFLVVLTLTLYVFESVRARDVATDMAQGMAEDIIVYSQELFAEMYRQSPVPYLVVDSTLTVESANLAAVRLFGVHDGWFEGKRIVSYLKGERDSQVELLAEYFKRQVSVNDESFAVVRPDGTERWVVLSLFSFQSRRVHKGLLTLVDVTKQKEVDRAKTEFVSLASHQLRTPISAMKWNIELLRTTSANRLGESEYSYITKIEHAVGRMEALVSDFLSVSKLELGTFVPEMVPVEIGTFIDSILESHEKQAAARGITIERVWNEGERISADTHLLEMAINNLISNAIKYSRDGSTVTIACERGGGRFLISVTDRGMGIPDSEQDKIFTKIYRASNAKAAVPDGTGLGLYIVRESIRVMGGDVTFASTEGVGTTFTITLVE